MSEALVSLRIGRFLTACLLLVLVGCGSELYQELETSFGGRIQLHLVAHDDPSLLLNARIIDSDGQVLGDGVWLGATRNYPAIGSDKFALYEAPDGVVGLYLRSEPGVLLLAVDFVAGEFVSEIASGWQGGAARRQEILGELSAVAGRPLEFTTTPVYF